MSKNESPYNRSTNWYGVFTTYANRVTEDSKAGENLRAIETIVGNRFLIPNKARLLKVRALLEKIGPPNLRERLLKTADEILAKRFGGEFRYHFSTRSPLKGQCSATSSFFSHLSQAITYDGKHKSH